MTYVFQNYILPKKVSLDTWYAHSIILLEKFAKALRTFYSISENVKNFFKKKCFYILCFLGQVEGSFNSNTKKLSVKVFLKILASHFLAIRPVASAGTLISVVTREIINWVLGHDLGGQFS